MIERPNATVLVVDDRVEARALVATELEEAGFDVVEAGDGVEGWHVFRKESPDLVVSDLRMPRADGIELLHRIRGESSVPVMLLTAFGDVPTAVAAMKGGAQEFLTFPEDLDRMVERARQMIAELRSRAAAENLEARIVGSSPGMQAVRERIAGLAPLDVPVLVTGEPGTGRDLVVDTLHRLSHGANAPLLRVDGSACTCIPPLPSRGGVYLDGVDGLPAEQQLQWTERILERERSADPAEVRIYASTSGPLHGGARPGSVEPKLAELLLRFRIALPPLRDRLEDVPDLVKSLLPGLGARLGGSEIRVTRPALAALRSHDWPGNVTELASVIERVVAFSPDRTVSKAGVEASFAESSEGVSSARERRHRDQRAELVMLLDSCGGNLAEVARRLGISRGAVIYRAHKYGLLAKPRSG